ncbi:MAG: SRPBCC domain-containing protein [Pseudomonadota bacterium]
MMTDDPIPLIVRRKIQAPRSRIFDAFTQANAIAQWFSPARDIVVEVLEFNFVPGGHFKLLWSLPDGRKPAVGGIFEQIDQSSQIVMSWTWQAPDPLENIPMRVTFRFVDRREATEVTVIHEGIPTDLACTVHADGWEGTLTNLESFLQRKSIA